MAARSLQQLPSIVIITEGQFLAQHIIHGQQQSERLSPRTRAMVGFHNPACSHDIDTKEKEGGATRGNSEAK